MLAEKWPSRILHYKMPENWYSLHCKVLHTSCHPDTIHPIQSNPSHFYHRGSRCYLWLPLALVLVNVYVFIEMNTNKWTSIDRPSVHLRTENHVFKCSQAWKSHIGQSHKSFFNLGGFSCGSAVLPPCQTSCCTAGPSKPSVCFACLKPSSSMLLLSLHFLPPSLDSWHLVTLV